MEYSNYINYYNIMMNLGRMIGFQMKHIYELGVPTAIVDCIDLTNRNNIYIKIMENLDIDHELLKHIIIWLTKYFPSISIKNKYVIKLTVNNDGLNLNLVAMNDCKNIHNVCSREPSDIEIGKKLQNIHHLLYMENRINCIYLGGFYEHDDKYDLNILKEKFNEMLCREISKFDVEELTKLNTYINSNDIMNIHKNKDLSDRIMFLQIENQNINSMKTFNNDVDIFKNYYEDVKEYKRQRKV